MLKSHLLSMLKCWSISGSHINAATRNVDTTRRAPGNDAIFPTGLRQPRERVKFRALINREYRGSSGCSPGVAHQHLSGRSYHSACGAYRRLGTTTGSVWLKHTLFSAEPKHGAIWIGCKYIRRPKILMMRGIHLRSGSRD